MTFVILVALVAFAASSFAAEEKLFYENRGDIPEQYRWNLELIFPDIDAWETAYAEVEAQIPELAAYKGRLGESADVMFVATVLLNDTLRTIEDIFVYARQLQRTDGRNAEANALSGGRTRCSSVSGKLRHSSRRRSVRSRTPQWRSFSRTRASRPTTTSSTIFCAPRTTSGPRRSKSYSPLRRCSGSPNILPLPDQRRHRLADHQGRKRRRRKGRPRALLHLHVQPGPPGPQGRRAGAVRHL